MISFLAIFWLTVLELQQLWPLSTGVLLPPEWANLTLNPCAEHSWKLLYWWKDGRCYDIFTQGPCRDTEEIFFDGNIGRASCRCSKDAAWHSQSQRCYRYFSKGPCAKREYFALKESKSTVKNVRSTGECVKYKQCPAGHLFWPPSEKCFLPFSRGPCIHGLLLYENPESGSTECGCNPDFMPTNFWKHSKSCHELYTKGPCINGHIFIYNLTRRDTECSCSPHIITNYHKQSNRCYELDTKGPCRLGQLFTFHSEVKETQCSCLPGYVKWPNTGYCYRAFTRGPCPQGSYLYPIEKGSEVGKCTENLCLSGELFDPHTEICYAVGKRGPCEVGKLWVYERATSIKGLCHCDPQLIGYWKPQEICYELGKRGPCSSRKIFSYDKNLGVLQCKCDVRSGFVSLKNRRCIKVKIQRKNDISVAEPIDDKLRGYSILHERIHRGLTSLPLQNGSMLIDSLPVPKNVTKYESILNNNNENSKCENKTNSIDALSLRDKST